MIVKDFDPMVIPICLEELPSSEVSILAEKSGCISCYVEIPIGLDWSEAMKDCETRVVASAKEKGFGMAILDRRVHRGGPIEHPMDLVYASLTEVFQTTFEKSGAGLGVVEKAT